MTRRQNNMRCIDFFLAIDLKACDFLFRLINRNNVRDMAN
jgi:hypothetical protein